MSLLYERAVQEDLNVGTGTTTVTIPSGGTRTATQIGLHTVAVGQSSFTATWNPASIGALSYEATNVAVPGAAVGDFVMATHAAMLTDDMVISGHVSGPDNVRVILFNPTASPVNLASGTLGVLVFKSR